jgi:hypothetical protein
MGKSDSWSLILNWLLLMLAVYKWKAYLPGTHATTQTFYCIILFSSQSTLYRYNRSAKGFKVTECIDRKYFDLLSSL